MYEQLKVIQVSTSVVFGTIAFLLGGYDESLSLLNVLILLDLFTGFTKAIVTKGIEAEKMYIGGIKKIMIYVLIVVSVQIERTFGNMLPLREIVIYYYIAQEGLSLTENVGYFIPLPDKLTQFFVNLKEEKKGKGRNK